MATPVYLGAPSSKHGLPPLRPNANKNKLLRRTDQNSEVVIDSYLQKRNINMPFIIAEKQERDEAMRKKIQKFINKRDYGSELKHKIPKNVINKPQNFMCETLTSSVSSFSELTYYGNDIEQIQRFGASPQIPTPINNKMSMDPSMNRQSLLNTVTTPEVKPLGKPLDRGLRPGLINKLKEKSKGSFSSQKINSDAIPIDLQSRRDSLQVHQKPQNMRKLQRIQTNLNPFKQSPTALDLNSKLETKLSHREQAQNRNIKTLSSMKDSGLKRMNHSNIKKSSFHQKASGSGSGDKIEEIERKQTASSKHTKVKSLQISGATNSPINQTEKQKQLKVVNKHQKNKRNSFLSSKGSFQEQSNEDSFDQALKNNSDQNNQQSIDQHQILPFEQLDNITMIAPQHGQQSSQSLQTYINQSYNNPHKYHLSQEYYNWSRHQEESTKVDDYFTVKLLTRVKPTKYAYFNMPFLQERSRAQDYPHQIYDNLSYAQSQAGHQYNTLNGSPVGRISHKRAQSEQQLAEMVIQMARNGSPIIDQIIEQLHIDNNKVSNAQSMS